MNIRSAEYLISNARADKCPDVHAPEYAFIGRSNVGKSSLINMLTGRKSLAKTSQMPATTRNLPGYGYAARGKKQREELNRIIRGYVLRRPQMTNLFVLVDSRHEPQKIDLEFIEWLGENAVPFSIVFTKADKLGPQALQTKIDSYCKVLLNQWEELPPIFVTSSTSGKGRDELLGYIETLNADYNEQGSGVSEQEPHN